ncbi:MAG TPA: beta-N-acetylhexosaminidase [Allosphingosinicella sp.]|jgi:beta-N-acetylhexosaminidase
MKPAIFGLSGERLTDDERRFFKDSDPAGYILFGRNCVDRDQLRALTDDLRSIHGRDDLPILIDQEGGRVARLRPPVWPDFPKAQRFAELYQVAPMSAIEAARVNAAALASVLREVGITVDCLPLLDVRQPGAHDIIGDRALGSDPMQVAALGRAVIEGLREGGVVGVVKHMPGHGRAGADSHLELPVVEASEAELETDIAPFRSLRDAPMGMTCHVVFTAWDPERPATLSPKVIGEIVRGRIGFEGLLMTDDIDMKAISGRPGEIAAAAIAAGCDLILDCWAKLDDMIERAEALPEMGPETRARLDRAMATIAGSEPRQPYEALAAKRDSLLAYA